MIISDFSGFVTEKERLSGAVCTADKWRIVPYETAKIKGNMLLAGECSFPESVTVDPKVKGWHKIYLCMATVGNENGVEVSVIDEKGNGGRTFVFPSFTRNVEDWTSWASYEFMEETLYKCADLTGKRIRFNKAKSVSHPYTSAIAFIRLEKMTEEEIAEYMRGKENKCVAYHFDCDYYFDADYEKAEEYIGRVEMLEGGNGELLIQETSFDQGKRAEVPLTPYLYSRRNNQANQERYLKDKDLIKDLVGKRAHELGMEYYAGMRLEMGDFFFPYNEPAWNDLSVHKYPQYRCVTRDGKELMALSFAYPQVRRAAINKILETLTEEFDGVSVFFHRGIHISHEKPVLDAVMEKYGVDARLLPYSDERLNSVLGDFLTEFMRELKAALNKTGKKYKVNVVVFDNVKDGKNFGLDVERWAKEGLIDSVAQGLMRHYEKLDGILDKNGLIDMQKYAERMAEVPVLRRWYNDTTDVLLKGITEFLPLSEYGIKIYGALAWEHKPREYQIDLAEKMQALGVERVIAWNANHIAKRPAVLQAVKSIGEPKEKAELFRKMHRVLSIDGVDISTFNPNWRG